MKITCALSQSQSEKLYKTVYKSLTEALKTEKKFSAQEYMANLFDKIADKKDEDTAVKFLQQVPSIIRTIAAKPAFDNLDIKLDPIKELSLKFKDEAEGFNEVQKYFKPQVSQRAKLALIRANQNNALLAEQVDPPTEVKDPVRLRPFSSNVSTMQLLIPINPKDKDKLLKEENDPAKKRIFSAIETIKKEAVLSDSTDVLSPISFQGKTLKLKPILLTELRKTHENQIDKTTLSEVIRAGAIKSQGTNKEGVEGLNRIALVITDENGDYLYFNEEGEMVTEEEGGGIVYQFMRDVRTDNGVYRLTNMYGSETSVKTPADIAEQMGITEEAARKLQQEEFKDLYKVKEATLKGNGPLLYLTGLTPGVKQSATQKNITLENLRSLPFVTNTTFKTITPKMIYGTKEIATITLNGQEYNLDRPNLPIEFANGKRQPSQLIRKIAAALANPNISNQEKYEYVSQFLSDKASEYTRRHTLSYDEATDTLIFGYNEKTYKEGSGQKLSFINEELTGKESIIEDVLLNAASDDRGNMYSAKMTYNAKALNDNRYRDYDMETNTISDEFTPYIPFLETLPNSKVIINDQNAPEFYNSHMNFSIPDEFTKEIEADFKNPDPINVSVTPVEPSEDIQAKIAEIETLEKEKQELLKTQKTYQDLLNQKWPISKYLKKPVDGKFDVVSATTTSDFNFKFKEYGKDYFFEIASAGLNAFEYKVISDKISQTTALSNIDEIIKPVTTELNSPKDGDNIVTIKPGVLKKEGNEYIVVTPAEVLYVKSEELNEPVEKVDTTEIDSRIAKAKEELAALEGAPVTNQAKREKNKERLLAKDVYYNANYNNGRADNLANSLDILFKKLGYNALANRYNYTTRNTGSGLSLENISNNWLKIILAENVDIRFLSALASELSFIESTLTEDEKSTFNIIKTIVNNYNSDILKDANNYLKTAQAIKDKKANNLYYNATIEGMDLAKETGFFPTDTTKKDFNNFYKWLNDQYFKDPRRYASSQEDEIKLKQYRDKWDDAYGKYVEINNELVPLKQAPIEQKWEWPPITQDDSINNATSPDNTTDPADDFSDFMFRKGADLNGVTEEQIKAAEEWWNSSPLAKYLDFKTMVNIVNSDVYARFIGYASVLNGKYGNIEISRTGTMVDVYHEAWHAFSQIFLTKEQREKLYKEIAKQPGTFTLLDGTTVAFKDANYLQLEEYLAEDFRSYGIDQSTKKGQPTRNTLFRKILNFIRDLFSSRSTKDRLFKELYFAKSNPKFLKKYSPNIDTTSFKQLNRGIVSLTDPTIDALNRQDAELISNSIDSYISEIIDAAANARGNKSGSISMLLGDKNKQAFYTRVRKDFETKLANARTSYEAIQNDPEKAMDAAKLLNKIRIFQAALDNFGDVKGGLVKYHLENTTFNLLRQKYIEVEEEVETETPVENNVEDSISQTSTPEESQPESVIKDSKIGKKSLLDLASKETVYILKSLHKLENGKPVYNELGYKELANFTQSWNNLMRAVNGEKNPEKIYENIKQAGLEVYPEFKQLLNSKLPKPSEIIKADNVNDKISQNKLLTNFWQDVQKTRVTYLQTTIFENGIAEVTKASIETASLANKFEAKFKGDLTNDYVVRSTENNIPMLNMDKIVEDFGKDGVLITDKSFEFAKAIGLYLDDLPIIKNELKKDQRSIQEYGLPYIYKTISDINKASKKQNLSSEGIEAITAFRLNPIRELMKGIPESVLGKEVSQKNKIDKILGLQAKYGVDSSNFAVLNAERNLVFEHIEDHSVSMIVFALNKATNMKELWTEGSEFEYLSYLNPKINSFTNRSQTINSLFDIASDMEKRVGRSLQLFVNSGTQLENGDGTNTTSLDAHGKFLQELHSMLKGGVQEFMRHASKSSSFGARVEGGVIGGVGKGSDTRLWVDLDKFALGTANNYLTKTHMIPYIAAELERINKFKSNKDLFKKYAGYNRPMPDGTMAGENFTAFDNVLTKETKDEILEKVTDPNMRLEDYLKTDPELAKKIANDVDAYFEFQTNDLLEFYEEAEYMSPDLLERLRVFNLSEDEATRVLMKAYAVNAWVHNFEMGNLFYGDLVQYNHEKEELHKRNTGSTSGGLKFRTDAAIKALLTDINSKVSYAATLPGMETLTYTGKFNTAILQDIERNSVYVKQIEEALRKDYEERFANSKMPKDKIQAEIDRRVQKEVAKYKGMEEGDGQGWITFDAYRSLKMASGQWSDVQEELFKKIINNEPVKASDIVEMFPAYKLQNYGHLADTALPVMAMHKFALAPMIPTMIKGSDLENLHMQMMKNNIQYVTFQTGSKVGSVTSEVNSKGKAVADKIYADEGQKSLLSSIKFTPNTIYLEYLKDVTQVPTSFKGKTVFATQLRKLILSNLYDRGILDKHSGLVKDYENTVDEYGNLLKMELLNDIGYEYKDGKYIGNFTEFLKVIQAELNRRDLPEHHVEFVNANPDNSLKTDLSLHLKSDDIEKILVALMEKRLVRQKIKGEALVQVSSAMTNGLWDNQVKFDKANEDEVRKFMGSNNLPFYNPTKDGTSAMKVAIALQGDFVNLLNAKHNDGEPIGTRERLNEMIKDDKWMAENGKSVSLSAVRIPVQGLNSMEYMQVWEFLDPAAGNIIIPPSEIVAKSGADFDVDKLTTFMPAISKDGKFIESELDNEAIKRLISDNKETPEGKAMISRVISQQKAALENKLITSINNILRLPENYAALVRPNDTYLLKDDVADVLEDKVTDYNRFNNYHGEPQRPGAKAKRSISPTRTLEPLYNLHKHDANMIGKAVLGLVAIYNALHPIYNSLDAKMPKHYLDTYYDKGLGKYVEGKNPISSRMFVPHNQTAEGNISLSDIYTADGVDLISDLYSQLINGAVDVEKDAWIFFIQGNMELAPMLLTMFKAGVPREYAIKFLSQPMIREYAKELRLLGGSYADLVADPLEDTKTGKNKRAAISVLERFGVINAPSYLKSDLKTHMALSALTKKSGVLNEEGQFDVALLDKMLEEDVSTDKYKNQQLAVFLHFLEMQNQFSGFQDLLRLSNPDTTTSKTTQEILLRKTLLNDIMKNSKVDPSLVSKLTNESILGTFYDNEIITQLIEPLFPLKNNPTVTKAIITLLTKKASEVKNIFGYGDDGKRMFISQYKNGLVNYLFQNAMYNYTRSDNNLLDIPSELIDKYFTGDVFFQNLDYSFADDILTLIEQNPSLKEKYNILYQLAKPELKEGQQILTLNDNKLLKSGALAESYYTNLKELADPNVKKSSDPEKNLYISNMFKLLPLMAIYQNGVGFSKYGFNEALPFDDFLAIMQPVSADFIDNKNKNTELLNVFNGIKEPKNRFFRNFVQIRPEDVVIRAQATQPTGEPISQTNKPKGVEVKEGIYVNQGALTKEEQLELFNYLKPFLEEQADKSLKATQGSKMIGLGLRWDYTSNNPGKTPINIPDPIIKNPRYGYYDQSVNGQPLGQITPRFRELMQKATGVDMTNYDGAIINLYEKDTFISSHNDVDESKSAIKYPVIGINLGGKGNFSIEPRDGSKIQTLDLQAGTGYIFGVDGVNRKVFHRTFPTPQDSFLPELTTKIDGKTYPAGSYRVTITMRRIMPLTQGIPQAPSIVSTQPTASTQVPGKTITYTPEGKKTQTYTIRGNQIFNSAGLEVFKGDSVDRNKIFANLAVSEGRAVVVEHNGSKYVVNNRNQIISGATGKMMQWPENNGDRVAILKKAEAKFKPTELDVTSDTVKEAEETPTPAASNMNARTFVLNSTEFQSWIKGELSKNPNLDVNKALDYYIKCKGL